MAHTGGQGHWVPYAKEYVMAMSNTGNKPGLKHLLAELDRLEAEVKRLEEALRVVTDGKVHWLEVACERLAEIERLKDQLMHFDNESEAMDEN